MFCVQVNFEISTADFNMPEEGKVVVYVNEVRYCVTRSCVRQGPVMCVTWFIHVSSHVTQYPLRVKSIWCVRDVTYSCVRHVSFMRATWLIHLCYVPQYPIGVQWIQCAFDVTHTCMECDPVTCVTRLIHVSRYVPQYQMKVHST